MRLRKVVLVAFLALSVPVAAASLAYACTALATLTVSSGAPGSTVTGTGKGFNGGGHGTPAGSTPVELRFNTRSGTLLATAVPLDAAGNIAFSFTAPNVPAGQYVLIGVQTNPANGTPFYGTPARQSLTILPSPARTSAEKADAGTEPAAVAGQQAASTGAATEGAAAATSAQAPAAGAQVGRPGSPAAASPNAAAAPGAAAAAGAGPEPASGTTPAGAAGAQTLTATAGPGGAFAATREGAGAAITAVEATETLGLVPSSLGGGRSFAPGVLLVLVGAGLGLVATGRLLRDRLPGLRDRSGSALT